MAKADKGATMSRLQSAARLSRTALAAASARPWFLRRPGPDHAVAQPGGRADAGPAGHRLGVRPPTITKTINRLQVQGFLDKRASETDARQAHVFLTDTGRDAIRAIDKSVRKTEKQALKGLDKKEQKALARLLSRIEANLSDAGFDRDRRRRSTPTNSLSLAGFLPGARRRGGLRRCAVIATKGARSRQSDSRVTALPTRSHDKRRRRRRSCSCCRPYVVFLPRHQRQVPGAVRHLGAVRRLGALPRPRRIVLVLFGAGEEPAMFRVVNLPAQILRGVFLFGSTIFNFLALKTLQLAETTSIFFFGADGDHRACRTAARRMGGLAALAGDRAVSSACWSSRGPASACSGSATSMRSAPCFPTASTSS